MSAEAPSVFDLMRTIRSSDLDPAAKILLLEILDRAGNGKGVCTASARTLARDSRVSERHVVRLLGDLAGGGWIIIERAGTSPNSPRRRITLAPKISLRKPAPAPTPCQSGKGVEPAPTLTLCQTYSDTRSELLRHNVRQTSPLTAKETSVDQTDGDGNSSCRTGGGEPEGTLDKAKVVELSSRCWHLPRETSEKLAARGDLAKRIEGDWGSLALAVVKAEMGRASGEIDIIKTPVAYLVKVAASIRDGEDPGPKVRSRLLAMLDGKPEPEARNHEREHQVDRAMNAGLMRFGMLQRWNELADGGLSVHGVERAIEAEIRETNELLSLHAWQVAQRADVCRRFLASMRAPESVACMDDDVEAEFTDHPRLLGA